MAKPTLSASTRDDASSPAQIIAGIGCRRGTGADEIIGLLETTLAALGLKAQSLIALATLDRKGDEPGLLAAAAAFGVPLRTVAASQLAGQAPVASAKVLRLVGVPSVAEAAAGLAGPLLSSKRKSAQATCALAACGPDFDLAAFGQAVSGDPVSTAAIAASSVPTSNAGP